MAEGIVYNVNMNTNSTPNEPTLAQQHFEGLANSVFGCCDMQSEGPMADDIVSVDGPQVDGTTTVRFSDGSELQVTILDPAFRNGPEA